MHQARAARGPRLVPYALTTVHIPLGRAHMLASSIIREARRTGLGAEALTPVGSLRRFAPSVDDVALLGVVSAARHQQVLQAFSRLPSAAAISAQSDSSVTVNTLRGSGDNAWPRQSRPALLSCGIRARPHTSISCGGAPTSEASDSWTERYTVPPVSG